MSVPQSLKSYQIAPLRPGELSVALSQSDGQSPAVAKLAGEQPLSMEAAANSRAQIEALLPAGYKPVFMNPLVSLYAARI